MKTKSNKKVSTPRGQKGIVGGGVNGAAAVAMIPMAPDDYAVQSRRTASNENDQIIHEGMDTNGHVGFRLNPQIYDAKNIRYVGLLGQQVRVKMYRPEAVMGLMDAIDTLIEAGTVVPMDILVGLLRNAVAEAQQLKR